MPDEDTPETDVHYEPDQAMLTAWELWLTEHAAIEAIARRLPPWNCYRRREVPHGHYTVEAYHENGTVTLNHGRDSFLPGIQVVGIPADELEACGCRRWRWPTTQQVFATQRHIQLTQEIKASKAKLRSARRFKAN